MNVSVEADLLKTLPCVGKILCMVLMLEIGKVDRFPTAAHLANYAGLQGADCVDLVANEGHCTLTLKVTGGTGRFKNAFGVLTYTETALPVLTDSSSNPVFF